MLLLLANVDVVLDAGDFVVVAHDNADVVDGDAVANAADVVIVASDVVDAVDGVAVVAAIITAFAAHFAFVIIDFFQLFTGKSCLPFLATTPSIKSTTSTNQDYCT